MLHYQDQVQALRKHDFTYLPPGVKHSIANDSDEPLRVLVMGFKIPSSISIGAPMPHPKVANLEDAKEETVNGHPNSVLYKLLIGLHTGKRDLIDEAYVMDSFFWMDFAPGGTNWPHHHQAAEEIYLVMDGQGEIVAGGGDGRRRRPLCRQGRRRLLLSSQLHGGLLQPGQTGRQGLHFGRSIAHSTARG